MKYHDNDAHDDGFEGPSKSEMKRQSAQWQALGERLMALEPFHWDKLPLTESLLRALEEGRRIKAHEALRRHRQYVGKLMRQEEVDAIRTYLTGLDSHRELNTRAFHALEALRERLIKGGNEVIGEVLARHPLADSQKLRQLVRDAKRASDDAAAARHSRELFRFLRALEDHDLTPGTADPEALSADNHEADDDSGNGDQYND